MKIVTGYAFAFVVELVYLVALFIMINRARGGMKIPSIYKVAGLDAMDEAIGRCTEMGRPFLLPVSVTLEQTPRRHVDPRIRAKQCARYGTRSPQQKHHHTPFPRKLEAKAYTEVGKVDAFKVETLDFCQFAYATGVTYHVPQPAANILVGAFWASLVFAEVGATAGAIQISGTANTHQNPFFVAACAYCLIGEELSAASAYLSREPVLLGSLVVQDWGKMVGVILIVAGTLITSFGSDSLAALLAK